MDLENKSFEVVGHVNVLGHKVPIVRDLRALHWAQQQPDCPTCPKCGNRIHVSYKKIGVERGIPVVEPVYSRLVIEEDGKQVCRACDARF